MPSTGLINLIYLKQFDLRKIFFQCDFDFKEDIILAKNLIKSFFDK